MVGLSPIATSSSHCTQRPLYFKEKNLCLTHLGASGVSEEGADDEDSDFDWEIEQTPYEEVSESALQSQCHYGFGNLRAGVIQRLQVCCPSGKTVAHRVFQPHFCLPGAFLR